MCYLPPSGLSNLHKLTSSAQYALRVDLRDGSDSAYAYYDKITISEPRSRYKIQVGTYSGTAGKLPPFAYLVVLRMIYWSCRMVQ